MDHLTMDPPLTLLMESNRSTRWIGWCGKVKWEERVSDALFLLFVSLPFGLCAREGSLRCSLFLIWSEANRRAKAGLGMERNFA